MLLTHCSQAHRFSTKSDKFIISLVSLLFNVCGPSAVQRLIIAIVVIALNGMSAGWTLPHVSKEILKDEPAITNGYSSQHVSVGTTRVLIGSSGFHICPTAIGASKSFAVCFQSNLINRLGSLFPDTPARQGWSLQSQKISSCNTEISRIAAVAFAEPHCRPRRFVGEPGYGESAKLRADEISSFSPLFTGSLDFDHLGWNFNISFLHGCYMFEVSEHPALLASGARAFSPTNETPSTAT